MALSSALSLKHMHSVGGEAFVLEGEQLLKLQLRTLELMEAVIGVCNEHGLRYTLSGGTALGAIRHGGFIPWDDDGDLNMPHADLVKLVDILRRDYAEKFDVLAPWSTHDYGLLFVQVRLRGTIAVKQEDFCTQSQGVCVDVFPLENMFDNPLRRALHGLECLALGFIVACKRVYDHRDLFIGLAQGNPDLLASFERKARIGRFFSFLTLDDWCLIADACYSKCKDEHSRYLAIPAGRFHFFGEMQPREAYLPPVLAKFEGRDWCVPGDWDAYFTALYGDYMTIPDEADREHHWYRQLEL